MLGPTDISAAGHAVDLAQPLGRAFAIRLALARGATVPDERMARDLWGESDLARPAERLRVLATRVRSALGEYGAALTRSGRGYALHASPVDLVAAESAIDGMHGHIRRSDFVAALACAEAALSHWRGPSLTDLRGFAFAAAEGDRLDAMWLAVRTEWLAAEVALGASRDVTGELEALVAEHPLDERLCCLLAVALYRGGRQADALAYLARLRKLLADELGVDPAPETAATELRLLRQDPDLAGRGQPARHPEPQPVAQQLPEPRLPPAASQFIGRDGESAAIRERLADRRLLTLIGPPGSGKTRLAVEVARSVRREGRPVAFVDLTRVHTDDAVIGAVAAAAGVEPGPADPIPVAHGRLAAHCS